MIIPFASAASGDISANTFGAALLYARSTQAADTGTLTVTGLDESAAVESEGFTLTGKREVLGADQFTKIVAAVLSASQTGDVSIYTAGTAAVAPCFLTAQPSDADIVTIGLTGFTQAYQFKNTTAAAYDVKIGSDANETAANLELAINADGAGDGSDYHTGTLINPYVSATVSSAVLTLTDKIPCLRSLGWDCSKSGANINISNPTGGADGTLLATIAAAGTGIFGAITLEDEALALDGLPGLVSWTSDSIQVSGKRFSIHVAAANVATAMVASYEYSTKTTATVWRTGLTSITDLDNNSQVITPAEVVEFVRLKIANANAAAASVNAKICRE